MLEQYREAVEARLRTILPEEEMPPAVSPRLSEAGTPGADSPLPPDTEAPGAELPQL